MAINVRRAAGTVGGSNAGIVGAPPGSGEWEDAPTELSRRVVFAEVYGDTGTGRTSWALSAPGPIALIHCAEKIEGIVQPFARNKKIRVHNFGAVIAGSNPQAIADQADVVWRALTAKWYDAFSWAKTIVLDTHTDTWELIRLARFGGLKPAGGRVDANYGPVNAEYDSLFKAFKAQDRCNVIVIGKTKEEYVKSKKGGSDGMGERTGRTIVAGQKDMQFRADVRVRTECNIMAATPDEMFTSRIEKSWWNAEVLGMEVPGPMSNFADTMGLITQTDPAEWGKE